MSSTQLEIFCLARLATRDSGHPLWKVWVLKSRSTTSHLFLLPKPKSPTCSKDGMPELSHKPPNSSPKNCSACDKKSTCPEGQQKRLALWIQKTTKRIKNLFWESNKKTKTKKTELRILHLKKKTGTFAPHLPSSRASTVHSPQSRPPRPRRWNSHPGPGYAPQIIQQTVIFLGWDTKKITVNSNKKLWFGVITLGYLNYPTSIGEYFF